MSIYTVDFDAFVRDYAPPNKREPVHLAWLKAVFVPLVQLHQATFVNYRGYIIGQAKQNGQRIILEDILNTVFSVSGPSFIYIDNSGDNVKGDLFFNQSEGQVIKPFYNIAEGVPADFFSNLSEVTNNRNFIVYVPAAVFASVGQTAIEYEVDRLKPYGTFYTIAQY